MTKMKKGRISKTESAMIKGLLAEGFNVEQISEELHRRPEAVEKELEKIANRLESEKSAASENAAIHGSNQTRFITESEGGRKGVAVMTPAASAAADDNAHKNRGDRGKLQSNKAKRFKSCIHKIHEDR